MSKYQETLLKDIYQGIMSIFTELIEKHQGKEIDIRLIPIIIQEILQTRDLRNIIKITHHNTWQAVLKDTLSTLLMIFPPPERSFTNIMLVSRIKPYLAMDLVRILPMARRMHTIMIGSLKSKIAKVKVE